jgi:MYXO-CTERM domain-containing protein
MLSKTTNKAMLFGAIALGLATARRKLRRYALN